MRRVPSCVGAAGTVAGGDDVQMPGGFFLVLRVWYWSMQVGKRCRKRWGRRENRAKEGAVMQVRWRSAGDVYGVVMHKCEEVLELTCGFRRYCFGVVRHLARSLLTVRPRHVLCAAGGSTSSYSRAPKQGEGPNYTSHSYLAADPPVMSIAVEACGFRGRSPRPVMVQLAAVRLHGAASLRAQCRTKSARPQISRNFTCHFKRQGSGRYETWRRVDCVGVEGATRGFCNW